MGNGKRATEKECRSCCTMNEKNEIAWLRVGILKLRVLRRGSERQRYPHVDKKRIIFTYS
jgi:hypothetical protein